MNKAEEIARIIALADGRGYRVMDLYSLPYKAGEEGTRFALDMIILTELRKSLDDYEYDEILEGMKIATEDNAHEGVRMAKIYLEQR